MQSQTVDRLLAVGVPSASDVPVRGYGLPPQIKSWANETDSALWTAGKKTGGVFALGLKAPGNRRGVYRGVQLVSAKEHAQAVQHVAAARGAVTLSKDNVLPLLKMKFDDIQALAAIRRLPFVDYLEPARVALFDGALASSSGCDWPNQRSPTGFAADYGDFLSLSHYRSRVPQAWQYAPDPGAGVTIGLVDTGVDMSNPEFQPNTFNIGFYSREIHQSSTIDGISVTCSHGTRMAGVMAAPRNGTGPIGVAYRSNLYSSWGQESVTSTNGVDQQQAIRDAVNAGAKVVVMAWATAYA